MPLHCTSIKVDPSHLTIQSNLIVMLIISRCETCIRMEECVMMYAYLVRPRKIGQIQSGIFSNQFYRSTNNSCWRQIIIGTIVLFNMITIISYSLYSRCNLTSGDAN